MEKKWVELFQGIAKSEIPFDGTGFILATHFDTQSNYTRIEIIAFKNVKNFVHSGDGITFYSDGFKIFLLYEPVTYRFRFMEPYLRDAKDSIPLRLKELHVMELPNHDRLFVSRQPYMSYGSFNIEKPDTGNFVYYFFDGPELENNLFHFTGKILIDDLKFPRTQVPQVTALIKENLDNFRSFA